MKDALQDLHDENERLGLYAQGEIIKLARQAGLCDAEGRDDNSIIITDHLEAFAKLVAAKHDPKIAIADAYRAGVDSGIAAEREALVALIERYGTWEKTEVICQAIRARS